MFDSFSQNLMLYKSKNLKEAQQFAENQNFKLHFQNSNIAILSGKNTSNQAVTSIENDAWKQDENYFYVSLPQNKEEYIQSISKFSTILYQEETYAILKISNSNASKLYPAVHGGLINIPQEELVVNEEDPYSLKEIVLNPEIVSMVDSIKIDSITDDIIHMQEYGTRNAYTPTSVEAQEWIKDQFENFGLEVLTQDFGMPGGEASDNVIAYQTGTVYPDKYVIIGGHSDSYSFNGLAPGADDNATGVAAIIEIARILSNYQFNHSLVYCAFSGEEYGLYGSQAFAAACYAENIDIIGYLNLDMIGYLEPGNDYFTGMCAYEESYPLANFFVDIVDTYVDNFSVDPYFYPIPNSDHTSFRNVGYMAIWPWEDVNNISPYIHSPADTFYISVNSTEYIEKFTEASLAFMAELAEPFNGYFPPMNLTYQETDNSVELTWERPTDFTDFYQYKVFKNDELIHSISTVTDTTYQDLDIVLAEEYSYYITAEYNGSVPGESLPSNTVQFVFGLHDLFSYNFEDNAQGWIIGNDQYTWQWGKNLSFGGNYSKYMGISSYEGGMNSNVTDYATSPYLNLKSNLYIEINYDYAYINQNIDEFEVYFKPTPAMSWIKLDSLSEASDFINTTLELPVAAQTDSCQIAFYYNDHGSWAKYAAFDNVKITGYNNDASFAAPENLNVEANTTDLTLTWDIPVSKNLLKYYIYRNNIVIDSVENTATTEYIDEDVDLEGYYYYFITGIYEGGQSAPSNYAIYGEPEFTNKLSESNIEFEIYPNPASKFINVKTEKLDNCQISIFDSNGKIVFQQKITEQESNIDLSDINTGLYLVQLKSASGVVQKKITIL